VKTQLLSQRPVAGVGNIYADEALWRAGVHPAARTVSRPQATRLHEAIRHVLAQGIDNGGTTLRDYVDADGGRGENQHALFCYGRQDEPCARCGALLRHTVLDARGTTWCPACQRR
jgi:formamidopyrimidine-DNA glycosylase